MSYITQKTIPGLLLILVTAASFCYADQKTVEVVGIGECDDCQLHNIKNSHAVKGLRVTVDCKQANGEIKTRGTGELDEEGKFRVEVPQELVENGKLKEECFAQLHSATDTLCLTDNGAESSKIAFASESDGRHTFSPVGKLKFSPSTCTSAFLLHFHRKPFPKLPPKKLFFKKPLPHVPILKKPCPPIYKKPIPHVPIFKKPPLLPIYKKPLPHPHVPIFKKPPLLPVYKKPLPHPHVPIFKKPILPPIPIYKKPLPPVHIPIYKKPLPTVPIYKKPLPPIPIYKKPLPSIPIVKKPCPPILKKLLPPIPVFNKPLLHPIPVFSKPPILVFKPKPLPPLPEFPPHPLFPPKSFDVPKFKDLPFVPHP